MTQGGKRQPYSFFALQQQRNRGSLSMATRKDLANAIRALAMDAVQKANSGYPGMPMGMAEIAEAVWNGHMRHNPANPKWADRDRFVLSNGHGSMLLYSLLHLTGYALTIDDLQQFRQLHSKTPGHPEYGYAPGIETTTGPLGQGIANAVGMAIAEKALAHEFNQPDHTVVDHHTYVFLGDGCMMEGISHEVCSLAGTLGLGKLIVFYDDNGISIDADDFLAVLAQQHAALRHVGVLGRHADDVAPGDVRVEAEQQVGRTQVEEVQCMRLQDLPVVHQATDLFRSRRQLRRAHHLVERLAGREVVADRADAAQALHHHRHFPVRAALDELLERAELDDVQACLLHVVVMIEQQRHLALALDARRRFDDYATQAFGFGGGFERGGVHGVSRSG